MNSPLHGQVALVTGSSRGIGRAVALRLATAGAHVVVNCLHNREAADATAAQIAAAGGSAEVIPFDVGDSDAVAASIEGLIERAGRCDILVNNAGFARDTLLLRMKEADWDRVMAVNLRGVFSCSKAVARAMVRARYGRIVNMSSVIGSMGNAGQVAYAAAKAGIIGLTKSLARELASRNITVNAVAPGFIDTEMVASLPEATRTEYLKLIPVGRLGTVDEVADAVSFLVRPAAAYITGQVIGVNGGLYM
ncbi:3-oxoacyl-[acyl-carrier-protein] reductase [Candidatus Binatia bacterium]|nr:3-oxoacyl-[acyl-carrier-protein] reductase [Candidatus Binatia bacterium]